MKKTTIGVTVALLGIVGLGCWLGASKASPVLVTGGSDVERSTSLASRHEESDSHRFSVRRRLGIRPTAASALGVAPASASSAPKSEDDAIAMVGNNPRQRAWRTTYGTEKQDEEWTARMRQHLKLQAEELLDDRAVSVWNLSCRRTICRMYLKFDDQLDAEAFSTAMREPGQEYEFQSLDPTFKGAGFDRSEYTYEVMVQRPNAAVAVQGNNEDEGESEGEAAKAVVDSTTGVAVAGAEEMTVFSGNTQ
jgi:hypothetical protein